MKKILGQALIITIIILLAGCTQQTVEPSIPKDGTYTAIGQTETDDWVPELSLTISNGKIIDVKYDETAAMRKSQSIEYQKNFTAQTSLDLINLYTSLQNSLIEVQDPSKLDTVAGATKSSANLKTLAEEALKNAKDGTKYIDGIYSAKGSADEKYWTPVVTITIADNRIKSVEYDEISSKVFKSKSQDISYIAEFKEKSNLDLLEVYNTLQNSLIEKQNPSKVEAIAGATQAQENFVKLAIEALEKAKSK